MSSFLKEGEDYTYEGSLMVFTKEYLLKRGKCCRRACKNCPYRDSSLWKTGFKKNLDKNL